MKPGPHPSFRSSFAVVCGQKRPSRSFRRCRLTESQLLHSPIVTPHSVAWRNGSSTRSDFCADERSDGLLLNSCCFTLTSGRRTQGPHAGCAAAQDFAHVDESCGGGPGPRSSRPGDFIPDHVDSALSITARGKRFFYPVCLSAGAEPVECPSPGVRDKTPFPHYRSNSLGSRKPQTRGTR